MTPFIQIGDVIVAVNELVFILKHDEDSIRIATKSGGAFFIGFESEEERDDAFDKALRDVNEQQNHDYKQ